jgi:hypothetical protein
MVFLFDQLDSVVFALAKLAAKPDDQVRIVFSLVL